MFTGIIEEIGKVTSIARGSASAVLNIEGPKVLSDSRLGDSIAVNGVCLTVTGIKGNCFTADLMAETLRRSSLGVLQVGSHVNLERAMSAEGRFGGHIVSGHIDGTGTIRLMKPEDNAIWIEIAASGELLKYIVEKGSIAIDGISLTVAGLTDDSFSVSVIPHTGQETTLLQKKAGDVVNLENDIIGKYVDRMLHFKEDKPEKAAGGITMEFLAKNGF